MTSSTTINTKEDNTVKLVRAGAEYFDLLVQLINKASESIHLQTYIYDDDETGIKVADALKAAAKRNVEVYLMADGYASQIMSKKFIAELRNAGVHFRYFEPLFRSKYFYFGRRMHHKVFVVDARYSLVGGINIANRYNDMPEEPAWLDFALYAEGNVSRQLCVLCWKTWKSFPRKMGITPCELKEINYSFKNADTAKVLMRRNDWVRNKKEISQTYFNMFNRANSHITIVCSYFFPGKTIRKLMSKAVDRGVIISVVTAGQSDVMLSKYAERWFYDWMLRKKIKLYEYQTGVLHAKIAVCDNEWFTVGSYNVNDISAYASIELNMEVYSANMAAELDNSLSNLIANECTAVTIERHKQSKNIFKQLVRWGSYIFIRVAFLLITFYYKQKK